MGAAAAAAACTPTDTTAFPLRSPHGARLPRGSRSSLSLFYVFVYYLSWWAPTREAPRRTFATALDQ
jgi:hypothetical protein